MRLSIIIAVFLFTPFVVNAQFEKTSKLVGGSASLSRVSSGSYSNTNTFLGVSYGYAVEEDVFLGVEISYSNFGGGGVFGLGPFLRRYISSSERGGVFAELQGGFVSGGGQTAGFIAPALGFSNLLGKGVLLDIKVSYKKSFENFRPNELSLSFGILGFLRHQEDE